MKKLLGFCLALVLTLTSLTAWAADTGKLQEIAGIGHHRGQGLERVQRAPLRGSHDNGFGNSGIRPGRVWPDCRLTINDNQAILHDQVFTRQEPGSQTLWVPVCRR